MSSGALQFKKVIIKFEVLYLWTYFMSVDKVFRQMSGSRDDVKQNCRERNKHCTPSHFFKHTRYSSHGRAQQLMNLGTACFFLCQKVCVENTLLTCYLFGLTLLLLCYLSYDLGSTIVNFLVSVLKSLISTFPNTSSNQKECDHNFIRS